MKRVSEQKGLNGLGFVQELEIQVQCFPACHKMLDCLSQFCKPRHQRLRVARALRLHTPKPKLQNSARSNLTFSASFQTHNLPPQLLANGTTTCL